MLNLYSRLLKLKEDKNDFDLIELKSEIESSANVLYKDWFVEKTEEIHNKK